MLRSGWLDHQVLEPGIARDLGGNPRFEFLRRVLLSIYLRRYFGSSAYRREQLDDWVPLMAAAYLGQGLTAQEDDKLITLIEATIGG